MPHLLKEITWIEQRRTAIIDIKDRLEIFRGEAHETVVIEVQMKDAVAGEATGQ